MLVEMCWHAGLVKLLAEIEVQANVDSIFERDVGRAFGIGHENHGAYCRDATALVALERGISFNLCPAPVICIYYQHDG
jgi:hypothetical protein